MGLLSRRQRLLLFGDEDADLVIGEPSQGETLSTNDYREGRQVEDVRESVISDLELGCFDRDLLPVVPPDFQEDGGARDLDFDVVGRCCIGHL